MPYGIAKFKEAEREINRKIKEAKKAGRKDEVKRLQEEKRKLNNDFEKELKEYRFIPKRHFIAKAVLIIIVLIVIYAIARNTIFGG